MLPVSKWMKELWSVLSYLPQAIYVFHPSQGQEDSAVVQEQQEVETKMMTGTRYFIIFINFLYIK